MTGNNAANNRNTGKWLLVLFSALLLVAFFIPWVAWDKSKLSGADMPLGNFFKTSEEVLGIANPVPQFASLFFTLWIIPVLAGVTLLLSLLNKRVRFIATLTGIIALSLATLYVLFTREFGVKSSFQIGIYITSIAAAGIILASVQGVLKKIIWLAIGPAITYIGYYEISKYFQNQKFENTANTSSHYTVNALDLIREFQTNDSMANAKYKEKILTVNGNISTMETANDSTVNIKFVDSAGSYAIFTFDKQDFPEAKKLKVGEKVSVKGSCSGGVLSEILGIEAITFKRCTLNK